tara:strand:- start:172 stop:561 length:390 start_codon:yes stop_codon:yes gene_type:complete
VQVSPLKNYFTIKNYIYIFLGLLFLVLGFIGLLLPVIPTTPFILVSVWFFARSSKKLENWLVNHKIFGKSIRDWKEKGAISKKAKMSAIPLILFSFSTTIYFSELFYLNLFLAFLGVSISTFIITRPNV